MEGPISKAGCSLACADPMRLHMLNEEVKSQGYKAFRGYGYCHVTRSIAGRILGLGLPHVLARIRVTVISTVTG